MNTNKNILVVGELNIDLILNGIKGFPVVGQEIMADSMNLTLGSSSAIFAANISMLGIPVAFSGMVGRDSFGDFIIEELKRKRVDTSGIVISEKDKTGLTVVMSYAEDRANVTYGGAMSTFSFEHLPADLSKYSHLHLSSYFLQKSLRTHVIDIFRKAKTDGLTTSLDLQWDPENKWIFPYKECLPFVDVFLPNETEILRLTQCTTIEEACGRLAPFVNVIVVKRGTKGAMAYQTGIYTSSEPFLHNQFVDAIGAGDSFNAGFISKYLKDDSLQNCMSFANLCGAINTTAPGGTSAFENISLFNEKAKSLFNIELI